MPKRNYNITSLQRGLRILRIFSETPAGLTAKQLAAKSLLPESTVHRFLSNLKDSGFLTCSSHGVYDLGIACVSIGISASSQLDLRRISQPHLQALNFQTRETVHLTVRHALAAVYIEKFDSPEPLRIHSRIGSSVPLFCSAVGKLFLAHLPTQERQELLAQIELKPLTPNTVASMQELQADLERIRKVGYACDMEEHELHVRCIAAPVFDYTGKVCASLSLTAPAVRMQAMRMRQLAPLVVAAGRAISRDLGFLSTAPVSGAPIHPARVPAQRVHTSSTLATAPAV